MHTPPLKRHHALQPLSREHFNGLVQARRLVRAADEDPGERRRRVSDFLGAWSGEISPHFADEERILAPLVSPEEAARLVKEHTLIRAAVRELAARADDPEPDLMRLLGRILHDHIRWEERSLFPEIEAAASEQQMQRVADRAREIEAERPGSRRYGDHTHTSPSR